MPIYNAIDALLMDSVVRRVSEITSYSLFYSMKKTLLKYNKIISVV